MVGVDERTGGRRVSGRRKGSWSAAMMPPRAMITARSMVFSSSRTFPGQSCASNRLIASWLMRAGAEPRP